MLPTREEAKRLLQEGEYCNPGPWGNHSRIAGDCAQKIAQACGSSLRQSGLRKSLCSGIVARYWQKIRHPSSGTCF